MATILAGNYCYSVKLANIMVMQFVSVYVVCAMVKNPFYFSDSVNKFM